MRNFFSILLINCWASVSVAQQFQPLASGFEYDVYGLYADTTSNLLYACGTFDHLGNGTLSHGISAWTGTNWDTAVSVDVLGHLRSATNYNGSVYTAGDALYNVGGNYLSGIGVWDGFNYQVVPISNGITDGVSYVFSHQNDLYACGSFNQIDGISCDNIARFDGVNWHGLPSLNLYSNQYSIYKNIVYQNEIYVGGAVSSANNIYGLAKFNGTNWSRVGNWPLSGASLGVYCFHEWNGNLYIGGYFNSNMGTAGNGIVKWDGTIFSAVGAGFNGNVLGIIDFNNELYVCGSIQASNNPNINYVAKWDGSTWYNIGIFDLPASSFATMNNKLYIGGAFLNVNGQQMNCITMYDPSVGIAESDKKYTALKTYPNPFKSSINIAVAGYPVENITVTDLMGRLVFKESFATTQGLVNNFSELCLENLSSGMYNLTVESKNKRETTRILKE
jgi:Secretion system C-terminal sorting domain